MISDRSRPLIALTEADPEHRIHSSFWPVKPRTGRFASSDPNMENIPRPGSMPYIRVPKGVDHTQVPDGLVEVKKPDGTIDPTRWQVGSVRECIIPASGWRLVSADESQIENRLVAHESRDPTLLAVFRRWDCAECGGSGETADPLHNCPSCGSPDGARDKTKAEQPPLYVWKCRRCSAKGKAPAKPEFCTECGSRELRGGGFCLGKDPHAHTSAVLGWHESKGYARGRQEAKAVNHATAYGMGADTMARNYGMDKKECKEALEQWHARHPNVKGVLHREVEDSIRQHGFVRIFDGHVRRFEVERLLYLSNNMQPWEWDKVIREGVNAKAQKGTAQIIKEAMWNVRQEFLDTAKFRDIKGINQVHDEILYEAPEEVAEDALKVVIKHLEDNRLTRMIEVPILAEGATGGTWGEAH